MSETAARGLPGRPKRQPVSQRVILSAPTRPGYERRWVNDKDDRIKLFEEGGWKPVVNNADIETADKAKMVESSLGSVVTRHTGGGTRSVLMEIKKEWYDEDQAKKIERVKSGQRDILESRTDGQYGKIEVER